MGALDRDAGADQQLEALLRQEYARPQIPSSPAENAPLVFFGAGHLGRSLLKRARLTGIQPVAFADETPALQGRVIDDLPVFSSQGAVERFGKTLLFVVTIYNPAASFLRIQERLQITTGARAISFLNLLFAHAESLLPHLQFAAPRFLIAQAAEVRQALRLFADAESRHQFVAHMRFRLTLDFAALPPKDPGGYFPSELLGPLPPDVTFVDCGAYDGDTIRLFLAYQREKFGHIIAFEPDAVNFDRLSAYLASLPQSLRQKIGVHHAGVGTHQKMSAFRTTGNTGASFDEAGGVLVPVMALDDVLSEPEGRLFIKLDVEGAEEEAIAGAERLIRRAGPTLAVSVYHRPSDLWRIPARLRALNPHYRLFLRTLGEDGMDVICYAMR